MGRAVERGKNMDYLLFSYPNCAKCDALKHRLGTVDFDGEEYDLTRKDSKMKIRDYLDVINRDSTGGIVIPTLVLREETRVVGVMNSREELDDWLRSKD